MEFSRYHPAINFLYFAAVLAGTILFRQPVYLVLSYVCAFLYLLKLRGLRALIPGLVFDDETKEICKEIVRCGGLDGRVNIALDYFDASINRISAWTVGFRNVEKALLSALCTPHAALKELQDTNQFTELMVRQEELKTLPFGEVWDEYCRRNGVPVDGAWFEEVKKYEQNVLCKRI